MNEERQSLRRSRCPALCVQPASITAAEIESERRKEMSWPGSKPSKCKRSVTVKQLILQHRPNGLSLSPRCQRGSLQMEGGCELDVRGASSVCPSPFFHSNTSRSFRECPWHLQPDHSSPPHSLQLGLWVHQAALRPREKQEPQLHRVHSVPAGTHFIQHQFRESSAWVFFSLLYIVIDIWGQQVW